jgi:hypothetical protein
MTYTYSSLRDDIIANMEEDSDEFLSALPTIISRAQQYLQKRMDAAQINRFVTVSCSAGSRELNLPVNLLVLKAVQAEVSGTTTNLLQQTNEYLTAYWPTYLDVGSPKYYANKDTTAIFLAPTPVSNLPITLEYVARITVLSSAAPTNWFSENAENAFFAAGMMQANLWTKNASAAAIWKGTADEELAAANNEFRRSRRSDVGDRSQGAPENNIADGST